LSLAFHLPLFHFETSLDAVGYQKYWAGYGVMHGTLKIV